jgi:hypothetical protein
MKKVIFLAIAIMFSASMAFGQTTTGGSSNPNYDANQLAHIEVLVDVIKPSGAHHAIITYRWVDEYENPGGWYVKSADAPTIGRIEFETLYCYLTNSVEPRMEYFIDIYKSDGNRIAYTSGTFYLNKFIENVLSINTLAYPSYPPATD